MSLAETEEILNVWAQWVTQAKTGNFFGDVRNVRNSIIDAEALIVLLLPQGEIAQLSLREGPNARGRGSLRLNKAMDRKATSDQLDVNVMLLVLNLLEDYFERYVDEDGAPQFYGGSYLDEAPAMPPEMKGGIVDLVDSYTMSVTLCLQVLYLLHRNAWQGHLDDKSKQQMQRISAAAHHRLTFALIGLCDSFALYELPRSTWEQRTGMKWPGEALRSVQRRIESLRSLGDREDWRVADGYAFECGWSWSRVNDPLNLAAISRTDYPSMSDPGPAESAPYFYFSMNAIDGITDLFAPWVQSEELLTSDQLGLVARLRNLWEITSRYWAALAMHTESDSDRWPIENVPWRASDGDSSIQWTLNLLGIAMREMQGGRMAVSETDFSRLVTLCEELGQRARVTRPPVDLAVSESVAAKLSEDELQDLRRDSALSIHDPGIEVGLYPGDERGGSKPYFTLRVYDFAPQYLKRCAALLTLARNEESRERVRRLIDATWTNHLDRRANSAKPPKYWDFVSRAYRSYEDVAIIEGPGGRAEPTGRVQSWYITERVVEALVAVQGAEFSLATSAPQTERLALELSASLSRSLTVMSATNGSREIEELTDKVQKARSKLRGNRPAEALGLLLEAASEVMELRERSSAGPAV